MRLINLVSITHHAIQTDTLGSPSAKFGKSISNVRFTLPFLVLVGISMRNKLMGVDTIALSSDNYFSSVSSEQFAAAVLGFLTYRIPLFLRQLLPLVFDSAGTLLPGSAGVALQLLQGSKEREKGEDDSPTTMPPLFEEQLKPVLLVCGPRATGKTTLVKKLVEEGGGKFVEPRWSDRVKEGPSFELMEERGQILVLDESTRYGLSKANILDATDLQKGQVAVVDASVDLARKIATLLEVRVIGVWVGLDSLEKFKARLEAQVESGELKIPSDESRDSFLRAKIREVIKDIEYGVISGLFEFTLLNDDVDQSLRELKAAAEYCFK